MNLTTNHNSVLLIPLTTPDLLAWVLVAFVGAILAIASFAWAKRRATEGVLYLLFRDRGVEILAVALVAINLAVMVIATYNPRYLIFSLPWLFVLVGRTWLPRIRARTWFQLLLVAIIALNLVNAHGSLYPSYRRVFEQVPNFFWNRERSLEIADDLMSERAAVEYVLTNHTDKIIYCEPPFGVYFSIPELGMVEKPLQGYCYGVFSDFMPGMRHAELTDVLDRHGSENVVVVGRYLGPSLLGMGATEVFSRPGFPPVGVWLPPKRPPVAPIPSGNETRDLLWIVVDADNKAAGHPTQVANLSTERLDACLASQAFNVGAGQSIKLQMDFTSSGPMIIEIILGRTPQLDFHQQWVRKATIDRHGRVAIDGVAVMSDPQARVFLRRSSSSIALIVQKASMTIHPPSTNSPQGEPADSP